MNDLNNFVKSRRTSGGSSTTSIPGSPSNLSFNSSTNNNNNNSNTILEPDYEHFWKDHQSKAREEGGYRKGDGSWIISPTIEDHSTKKSYCDALFLAHEVLTRWNNFEQDNRDLPMNVIDLRRLNIEEALIVVEENLSAARSEIINVEFIVGSEGRKLGKLTPFKTKLRSSVESLLTERVLEWSPAEDDRVIVKLELSNGTLKPILSRIDDDLPNLPIRPRPTSRFGLQGLKEAKMHFTSLGSFRRSSVGHEHGVELTPSRLPPPPRFVSV